MSNSAERYVKSDKRKVYFRTKNKHIDLNDYPDINLSLPFKILYRCYKDNVILHRAYSLAHRQYSETDHLTIAESAKSLISSDIQFFKESQRYDSIHILVDGNLLKIIEFK